MISIGMVAFLSKSSIFNGDRNDKESKAKYFFDPRKLKPLLVLTFEGVASVPRRNILKLKVFVKMKKVRKVNDL